MSNIIKSPLFSSFFDGMEEFESLFKACQVGEYNLLEDSDLKIEINLMR